MPIFYPNFQPEVLSCHSGYGYGTSLDIKVSVFEEVSNCHSRPECQETHLIYDINFLQNLIHISPTKTVVSA